MRKERKREDIQKSEGSIVSLVVFRYTLSSLSVEMIADINTVAAEKERG